MSLSIWLVTDASDVTWTVIAADAADALAVAIGAGMDIEGSITIEPDDHDAGGRRCVQYESEADREADLQRLCQYGADPSELRLITSGDGTGEHPRRELWAWDRDWIRAGRGLLCGGES